MESYFDRIGIGCDLLFLVSRVLRIWSCLIIRSLQHKLRVATNLENLEYSGISLNMENSGNSVQPQGKIVTDTVF